MSYNGIHISNNESFAHEYLPEPFECHICGVVARHRIGYLGGLCDNCGVLNTADCLNDICLIQREQLLKMSRRKVSLLDEIPYSENQIKDVERCCEREEIARGYAKSLKRYIKTINVRG